jgi:[acyl-carrier-protein] S-malonyltransferase
MTGVAILCSGQGHQGAGMFDLLADAPEASPVFEAAKSVLGGKDPRQLVREATKDDLHADAVAQVLCCTQAMAAWAVLSAKLPRPLVVAGYSIGELAAWGVAGLLDYKDVFDLAAQRAQAMDKATTQPSGLVAIHGLKRDTLNPICKARGAYVAIVNAQDQILVGGTRKALDAVIQDARVAGAERITILPVAVPSHTPLMAKASDQFRQALAKAHLPAEVPAGVRLLSGIDGDTVFDVHSGADKLARQIQQTVNWAGCMESCRAAGATKVVELGPGNALAHMMHEFMPDGDVHSLSEFHSLSGFEHWTERLLRKSRVENPMTLGLIRAREPPRTRAGG